MQRKAISVDFLSVYLIWNDLKFSQEMNTVEQSVVTATYLACHWIIILPLSPRSIFELAVCSSI